MSETGGGNTNKLRSKLAWSGCGRSGGRFKRLYLSREAPVPAMLLTYSQHKFGVAVTATHRAEQLPRCMRKVELVNI